MTRIRSEACSACPYKRSTPSGVWDESEYDKLRGYDAPTADQPMAGFACHATPEHFCNGWAVVHMNRGHDHALIALRLAGSPPLPLADLSLYYDSGNEAADAGQSDVEYPSEEASEAIDRLTRKYPRLRS